MGLPATSDDPSVAAAVVVDDGKILLVRRQMREGRLSWQLPAGKVGAGESAEEAAVRETLEETGVAVRALRRLGQRTHPDTGRTMIYVACEVVGGSASVMSEREIAEVVWSDHAAVATYIPYPLYGPVQEYLDDILQPIVGQ